MWLESAIWKRSEWIIASYGWTNYRNHQWVWICYEAPNRQFAWGLLSRLDLEISRFNVIDHFPVYFKAFPKIIHHDSPQGACLAAKKPSLGCDIDYHIRLAHTLHSQLRLLPPGPSSIRFPGKACETINCLAWTLSIASSTTPTNVDQLPNMIGLGSVMLVAVLGTLFKQIDLGGI